MVTAAVRRLVKKSNHKQHKHAVMIFRGGALVATGYNHEDIHAEQVALGKLWPDHRVGTRVVSIRLRKNGELGMAKPCPKCEVMLREAGVKSVMFSNYEGQMEKMSL
jgi:deoxycytidylate deaminase